MSKTFTKSYFLNNEPEYLSDQDQQTKEQTIKPICQICSQNPHKYKCPGCDRLTCSLACINKHKQQYKCDGKKSTQSQQLIRLADFGLNHLKRDMNFIQEAISQSNSVKKSTFEAQVDSKVPKRIKNLRYFLKKKRGIIYKQAPRQLAHLRQRLRLKNQVTTGVVTKHLKYSWWSQSLEI
eukprot:403343093